MDKENRKKTWLLDSSLIALLIKIFGVPAVMEWLNKLLAQGDHVVINEAGAIDNALFMAMPELLEKMVKAGNVHCRMYAADTVYKTIYVMLGGGKENFRGFNFASIPGAQVNWSLKKTAPKNMDELRRFIEAEGCLAGYVEALWTNTLNFAKCAVPRAVFDSEHGWTPQCKWKPDMPALKKYLNRWEMQELMEDYEFSKPDLTVRCEGLRFALWLGAVEHLKPEKSVKLFQDCMAEYMEGLRVQHGCEGIALLEKLSSVSYEKLRAAFEAIYGPVSLV